MVYKTKLMVGVPSLTHIDIWLRPYIYSPGYIWAQGSTYFLFMHHVYIYIIKKKLVGRKWTRLRSYFTSENFQKSVMWHHRWDIHSPRTWTLLTWRTKNMNREINGQRHHMMDWLKCNQKMIVFILSQFQNPRLVQAGFQRWSDFYTGTVLLY